MNYSQALLRAISESYIVLNADTLRVEVLDRDLSDDEITRVWGTDVAFRTRQYAKDGGQ